MAGNSFGQLFRITTWGESHGAGIGVVIDGVPPNVEISELEIQKELDRRKPGQSSVTTPRKEPDHVEFLSGVLEGKTTGTALAMFIKNTSHRSQDYSKIQTVYRPGHADFNYENKYGIRDPRGGGRSSGRETAARVAAGAIAKKILSAHGVNITAYTIAIGEVVAEGRDLRNIETNSVRCPDMSAAEKMIAVVEDARKDKDSIGGLVECIITGCPQGLGDPVFDKLDALLAHAMLSLGAVKGIEFGDGFDVAKAVGSFNNDELEVRDNKVRVKTNHSGGIQGGISNGETILFRIAVKPTPSIEKLQQSVDNELNPVDLEIKGRHDPCICPRIVPVVEAMAALTLLDRLMVQETIRRPV